MLLYELMEPSKRRRLAETGLTFKGYPCTVDCMGHKAGHDWATRWGINEPDECPYGNSNSFWEGCKSKTEEGSDLEEGQIIDHDAFMDVYLKGKHQGEMIQKKVGERIPNRLVNAFINKVASKFGLNPTAFVYGPCRDDVAENFADGRVKGKSRPGRVSRAGASCNGSVTDLRQRAKNASGEKAKMYHWCANMKSGRNK